MTRRQEDAEMPGDGNGAVALSQNELENIRKIMAENEELKKKVLKAETKIARIQGKAMPQFRGDQHSQAKKRKVPTAEARGDEEGVLTKEELVNVSTLMEMTVDKLLKDQMEKAEQRTVNLSDINNGRTSAVIADQHSQVKTPVLKEGTSYSQGRPGGNRSDKLKKHRPVLRIRPVNVSIRAIPTTQVWVEAELGDGPPVMVSIRGREEHKTRGRPPGRWVPGGRRISLRLKPGRPDWRARNIIWINGENTWAWRRNRMDRVPRNHPGPSTSMEVNKTKESNDPDSSDETEDTDEDEEEDHKTSSEHDENNDFDSSDETEDAEEDKEEDHKSISPTTSDDTVEDEKEEHETIDLVSSDDSDDDMEYAQLMTTLKGDSFEFSSSSEDEEVQNPDRKIETYLTGGGEKKKNDLIKLSVLKVDNHNVGSAAILDSGCAGSLMGYEFLEDYAKRLSSKDRKGLAKMPSKSTFSFGDGRTVKSVAKIKCPIYLGLSKFVIDVDLVDVKIPMLISLQDMQRMEMQLHLSDKTENKAYVNGQFVRLIDRSGHIWASVTRETSKGHVIDQVESEQILLASKSIFQDGNIRNQLKKLHDNLGHMARDRLEEVVKEGGYWSNEMKREMDHLYSICPSRKCRTRRQLGKGPVASFKMARQFGEVVGTDLKIRHGKDDILYMIDHCTSYATASLIKSKEGEEIAMRMFEAWYSKGLPRIRVLISDNGTEYLNPAVTSFVESHNTVHMCSVPYHPEGNGVTERVHSLIDMNMTSIIESNPEISDKMALDLAVLAYNQSEMRSGFTPSQLVYGHAGALTSIAEMTPQEEDKSHLQHRFGNLFKAREDAIVGHIKAKTSNKIKEVLRRKSRPTTEKKKVGEWVWLFKKEKWHGPGRVCAALDTEIAVKIGGRWHGAKHSDLLPLTRKEILDKNLHRISEVDFEATKTFKSKGQDEAENNEEFIYSYLFYPFGVEAIHATDVQQAAEGGQHVQHDQLEANQEGIRGHDSAQGHDEVQLEEGGRGQDRDQDEDQHRGSQLQQVSGGEDHQLQSVTSQVRGTLGNTSTEKVSTAHVNPDYKGIKSNDRIEIFDQRDKVWERAVIKTKYRSRNDQFNVRFDIEPEAKRVFCPKKSEWRFYNETPRSKEILVTDKKKHSVLVTQIPRYRHNDEDIVKAKDKELDKLQQFGTYEEVREAKLTPSQRSNMIASTWAIVDKGTAGDSVIKARLCARGDLEKVEIRTDSPTTSKASIRLTLTIAASQKWVLHSLDFTSAFLQGTDLEREVFLKPPPDVRERKPGVVWRLVKRIYGLKDASRGWYLELSNYLQELGGQLVDLDQAMYCFKDRHGQLSGVIAGHVDDLVYGGNKEFHKNVIKKIIDKYVVGKVDISKFTFVGWELSQTEDGILLSQKQYLEDIDMDEFQELKMAKGRKQEIVGDELQHLFRSANGLLGWIVQVSRPDLNFVFVEKSTHLGNATVEDCRSIYRVLLKARQEIREIKFSNLGPMSEWGLKLFTDASYRKLNTVDSVGGDLVFITGNNRVNILQWNSGKIKVPVTSPLTAESWAAKKAYGKSCFYKKLIKQVTGYKPKISLVTDSKSLYDAAHSDNAISDERNAVYVSVIRAAIKWQKLTLSWTEREFQPADVLTKTGANPYLLMRILAKGKLPRELRHDPRPKF